MSPRVRDSGADRMTVSAREKKNDGIDGAEIVSDVEKEHSVQVSSASAT